MFVKSVSKVVFFPFLCFTSKNLFIRGMRTEKYTCLLFSHVKSWEVEVWPVSHDMSLGNYLFPHSPTPIPPPLPPLGKTMELLELFPVR